MKIIKQKVTTIFLQTRNSKKNIVVNIGGTRSGKSYALCQLFIEKLFTEPKKELAIVRKYASTLRYSTYKMFLQLLAEMNLYDEQLHNKSLRTYFAPNTQSTVYFLGLDDFEKLKSTEFNYIWMEEATEFEFDDFIVLYNHLSAPSIDGKLNQMFLTCNPDYEPGHWIETELFKFDVELIKSSYLDNPFLSKQYIAQLEKLKDIDEILYKIYVKGERAEVKDRVFEKFEIVPGPIGKLLSYGLDFGYKEPTAIVAVYTGDDFWCFDEKFYDTEVSINTLANFIKDELDTKTTIYADPSRPDLIEYLRRQGIKIEKAKTDVLIGLNLMKSKKIYVTERSANLIKEMKIYKWKRKENILTDTPVGLYDHAIDAARYGLYSAYQQGKVVDPVLISIIDVKKSKWR